MDWLALLGTAAALAATGLAALAGRAGRTRAALAALVLAAACLRVPPAAHFSLSRWDERFHALVARNALDDPLVPLLVAHPLVEPAPDDWGHAHVWLHKPPLTTWLMAGAMALFGTNEVALRVPSIAFSSLCVWVLFALARRFVSTRAALVAAGLAAWNARDVQLVAGVRATDHVDALMTVAVTVGALAAVRAAESLGKGRARFAAATALVGAATALAYYTKETPALVVPAIFFFALQARGAPLRTGVGATAGALGVAALLVAPWQIYTASAFPAVAAVARARGAQYFLHVVDRQGGPWYYHFANLPLDFGWLAPLALALFALEALRRRRELLPLVAWFLLVYGVFTLAATKMQSYVLVAAPAVFVALAWLAADALPGGSGPALRNLHRAVLIVLVANAALSVLQVETPLEAKARDPLWTRELRRLGAEVERLPPGKRVVFGAPSQVECMFYARATCVARAASAEDVARARAAGFAVAVYGEPAVAGAAAIPIDPRTLPARRLAAALSSASAREALVFNARDAADLREYLVRTLPHCTVSSGMPRPSRWLARKLAEGAELAVLLPPGADPPPAVRAAFPQALFVDDASYARELDSAAR